MTQHRHYIHYQSQTSHLGHFWLGFSYVICSLLFKFYDFALKFTGETPCKLVTALSKAIKLKTCLSLNKAKGQTYFLAVARKPEIEKKSSNVYIPLTTV